MATFTFFDAFKQYMGGGATPDMDLSTDSFVMYLSNDAPVVATDETITDVPAITEQNGYTETALTTTWEETGASTGIWRLVNNADVSWTASGGSFGPFQYVVVYNTTLTSPADLLVGYWDNGSATTIADGNTFNVDLDANFTLFTFDG